MPTIAEIIAIEETLRSLRLSTPLTRGALSVVPLLARDRHELDWLTLPEAGDAVAIMEVSEEGAVSRLTVANNADRPLLLLDGEGLIGAKQNRILNTTVLVAARSTVEIPVSCVEQGRWDYRGRRFSASKAWLYASLRARNLARVNESLRSGTGYVGDQGEVWAGVAARAAHHWRGTWITHPDGVREMLTLSPEAWASLRRQMPAAVSAYFDALEAWGRHLISLAGAPELPPAPEFFEAFKEWIDQQDDSLDTLLRTIPPPPAPPEEELARWDRRSRRKRRWRSRAGGAVVDAVIGALARLISFASLRRR